MTTTRSQPAIRATGLRKSLGDQVVLDGIDLEVPEGTIAGDKDLQRLGRVLGLLVRPEPLHQPGGAAARAQVTGEQREEAA
jgi:ABC-2 type transport system ATP-binding protein